MYYRHTFRLALLLSLALGLTAVAPVSPQVGVPLPASKAQLRTAPRLEAVADTRLLMDGINWPNFMGMEQLLKQKPANVDTWSTIRGQALLIAENGNLLMLRPPRNQGEETWMQRAASLRSKAVQLARAAAAQDHERSRTELKELASTCNRCHQSFRVDVRIT